MGGVPFDGWFAVVVEGDVSFDGVVVWVAEYESGVRVCSGDALCEVGGAFFEALWGDARACCSGCEEVAGWELEEAECCDAVFAGDFEGAFVRCGEGGEDFAEPSGELSVCFHGDAGLVGGCSFLVAEGEWDDDAVVVWVVECEAGLFAVALVDVDCLVVEGASGGDGEVFSEYVEAFDCLDVGGEGAALDCEVAFGCCCEVGGGPAVEVVGDLFFEGACLGAEPDRTGGPMVVVVQKKNTNGVAVTLDGVCEVLKVRRFLGVRAAEPGHRSYREQATWEFPYVPLDPPFGLGSRAAEPVFEHIRPFVLQSSAVYRYAS